MPTLWVSGAMWFALLATTEIMQMVSPTCTWSKQKKLPIWSIKTIRRFMPTKYILMLIAGSQAQEWQRIRR